MSMIPVNTHLLKNIDLLIALMVVVHDNVFSLPLNFLGPFLIGTYVHCTLVPL